jgi:hypothetical protein
LLILCTLKKIFNKINIIIFKKYQWKSSWKRDVLVSNTPMSLKATLGAAVNLAEGQTLNTLKSEQELRDQQFPNGKDRI